MRGEGGGASYGLLIMPSEPHFVLIYFTPLYLSILLYIYIPVCIHHLTLVFFLFFMFIFHHDIAKTELFDFPIFATNLIKRCDGRRSESEPDTGTRQEVYIFVKHFPLHPL